MFEKILIANRGEIACRVIKTARILGIRTVAVYSDADKNSLHVCMADEAVHIGAAPSRESYLIGERIIKAAQKTGAQAIHPGYGFLSENSDFCKQCADNNIVFIGPPVEAIEAMGSKSAAKKIMAEANVPLVPGYHGEDQNPELLRQSANEMGYPVLLKAVAGGGGKGMRQVWSPEEFDEALAAAKRESMSSFNNDDMLVEKYLTQPRHVEVQVFCDQHGKGVYLFERDCSVQRRHQKVIEEAPAPNMPEGLREQMGETAVRAAQVINYQGAGTVEFLLDTNSDGGHSFYFMEMNTRLQVEHPVTEMITRQDLVEWQLRVAAGEHLPMTQEQLCITGHAIEARIYAEDPDNDFLPVTGKLGYLQTPKENAHVRVDTGVVQGDEVSVYYDPMIAKLIVWDKNRNRALARLTRALTEYHISGITTNISFLYNLVTCAPFAEADLDTGFIEKHEKTIFKEYSKNIHNQVPLCSLYLLLHREQNNYELNNKNDPSSPWNLASAWRLNAPNVHNETILISGNQVMVSIEELDSKKPEQFKIHYDGDIMVANASLSGNTLSAEINGYSQKVTVASLEDHFILFTEYGSLDFKSAEPDYGDIEATGKNPGFTAPMNGTVIKVLAQAGAKVKKDDTLLIMEAMKMELAIRAPADGVVKEIYYKPDDLVEGGAELLAFEQT